MDNDQEKPEVEKSEAVPVDREPTFEEVLARQTAIWQRHAQDSTGEDDEPAVKPTRKTKK